jgi:hypothetical protein
MQHCCEDLTKQIIRGTNNMKLKYRSWVFSCMRVAALGALLVPGLAQAKAPRMSAQTIDTKTCPSSGEGARRCKALADYEVVVTVSEMSEFRLVVREKDGFQLFLEAPECEEAHHDANIEFRLFEGEPFAVIQRIECFKPNTMQGDEKKARKPVSSYITVRGLMGFEKLTYDLKMKGAGGEQKARQLAESFLLKLWPELEAARAPKVPEAATPEAAE